MEFGAIPVFLRPTDTAQNFLNDIHWKGFPGPVLTSWNQLEEFLSSMTDSKMDALQQEVRAWYANAKLTKKQALSHQLRLAFSGVKYASNGTTGDSNNRASIHPVSGKNGAVDANSDVGAAHRVEDIQRIITDLKFNEISPGQYEQNIQSLLAMLIKQDARIKLLERSVQALTDKQ